MRLFLGLFVIVVVGVNTVLVCTPLFLLGLLRLAIPLAAWRRPFAYPMDLVIDAWVSVFGGLIHLLRLIEVEEDFQPDTSDRRSWQMIVSNHQSWVDILILQKAFRHRTPVLKFFTKRELIWLPFVGLAMWFLGFPYVYRTGNKPSEVATAQREINEAVMQREGSRFLDKPVAVINFVEGTRFTETKRVTRNSPYRQLLAPRRGGTVQVLSILGEKLDSVINATIQYHGDVPGFWDLLTGRATKATLIVRQVAKPASNEANDVGLWLDELWQAKDKTLIENRAIQS